MKTTTFLIAFILGITFGKCQVQSNSSFSVRIAGTGTSVAILIPGYSCSGEVWDGLVEKYKTRFTFHIVTFAGFAGEKPQQSPEFSKWIDDVALYISSKNLDSPVIIGHSLGGVVAMDLAARYPDRVSKIIVVDALPSLSALYNPNFKVTENLSCESTIAQFKSMDNNQFYTLQKSSTRFMLADTSKLEKVVSWSVKSDRYTLASIFCQFMNYDLRSTLSNIKCPSLILLEPSFQSRASAIDSQFKNLDKQNTTFRYASKGLHFIMYDDADWFFNQVDEFTK